MPVLAVVFAPVASGGINIFRRAALPVTPSESTVANTDMMPSAKISRFTNDFQGLLLLNRWAPYRGRTCHGSSGKVGKTRETGTEHAASADDKYNPAQAITVENFATPFFRSV